MLVPQATAERAIWRSGCSQGGTHTSIWYMGSNVTTCVGVAPCEASHSFFSSSVQVFSVMIGVHGSAVAIGRSPPSLAKSVSSGEALRYLGPTQLSGDRLFLRYRRVYAALVAPAAARSLQLRCSQAQPATARCSQA